MERIAFILTCLSCLAISACSSQKISAPLNHNPLENQHHRWSSDQGSIVTHCQANDVTRLNFVIDQDGSWNSEITLRNIDTQFYRPSWNNNVSIVFRQSKEDFFTLGLVNEIMPSKSTHTYRRSGVLEDPGLIAKLRSATVNVEHQCHGILRSNNDNANINASHRRKTHDRG